MNATNSTSTTTEQPTDHRPRLIGGIEVRLCWGHYRVEHFGSAPHVAVLFRDPQGNLFTGWLPQPIWDGGKL